MARYCVELDFQSQNFVVHKQSCDLYHDVHQLVLSRVTDIGEFSNSRMALNTAREEYPGAIACSCCAAHLAAMPAVRLAAV